MALFLVNKSPHEGIVDKNLVLTHKLHPLLVSAWSKPTSVLITNNEGETLTVVRGPQSNATTKADLSVSSLAWHPTIKLLVIGWSDGRLSLWSIPEMGELGIDEHEVLNMNGYVSNVFLSLAAKAARYSDVEGAIQGHHELPAILCEWTTKGQYLLSGSCEVVTLWVLESGTSQKLTNAPGTPPTIHKLKLLWSVNTPEPIVRAIHVPHNIRLLQMKVAVNYTANGDSGTPQVGDSAAESVPAQATEVMDDEITFLLWGGNRTIHYITDEQAIHTVISPTNDIGSILYEPTERMLVTWSSNYMIDVYRLREDISPTLLLQRKISTPSLSATKAEKPVISLCFAGPTVVAFCSGDDRIRLLDIDTENLYTIAFPQAGAHICAIASRIRKGMLVAGTSEGIVAIFAHSAPSALSENQVSDRKKNRFHALLCDERSSAEDHITAKIHDVGKEWEALTTHSLSEHIDRIELNPLGDIAMCTNNAHLQVLHQAQRHRAWDGVAAATQISTNLVVIESVTGCQGLLKSKNKVRGLSVAFPCIALWDGSQIDVYTINESTSNFTHITFVLTTSPAFAIHRDGLLYVKDGSIIFITLQMHSIGQIAFMEAEGVPVVLDVMKDFVVAVSSKNILRLARISSQGLLPMGPARPFRLTEDEAENSKITVVSVRINGQGRRVALLTKVGLLGIPDTRIWVYDTDIDKVMSFDFAERNEVPDAIYWNTPDPNPSTFGELEYLMLACETHQMHECDSDVNENAISHRMPAASTISNGDTESNAKVPFSETTTQHVHRENLPDTMPDMENFSDKKEIVDGERNLLGMSNVLGNRAHNIVTLFSTHKGLVVHNSASLKRYQICLVGLTIPDFLLSSVKINGNASNAEDYVIEQKRLRDFDGLESDKDVAIREALMKFSYYSTIDDMDEAYRCIKSIKDPTVWQNLARICLSSGRVDVAAVCLANIGDAIAARALRETAEKFPFEKKVQLATLACSIGMIDESEKLLRESGQYGLITDLFFACGKFEHAQRHTERFDRMRIRAVAYKYAQFMEGLQSMDAAVMWYYNARCVFTDVPRIYYQTNRLHELWELMGLGGSSVNNTSSPAGTPLSHKAGVDVKEDAAADEPRKTFAALFPQNKDLLRWWAKRSESRRNACDALRFYDACNDTYNKVRLLCLLSPPQIDKAIDLVDREVEKSLAKFRQCSSMAVSHGSDEGKRPLDPEPVGAAVFIGQHYERAGDFAKALQYYKHAGAYYSGMRVSKRAERVEDCLAVALSSCDRQLLLEAALYLSKKGAYDKAVMLFSKIGAVQCALAACIEGGLFDTFFHIIDTPSFDYQNKSELLTSLAAHFKCTGNYTKAVETLLIVNKYKDALQLCEEKNVSLTPLMADYMAKVSFNNKAEMTDAFRRFACLARDQGKWELASKYYSKSDEFAESMKMLIHIGDPEKVIFFASLARKKETYILAANFLQTQSWNVNLNIFRNILFFYAKADAYESIIHFYDSCAQFYIDEERNYPKALSMLKDCLPICERVINISSGNNDTGSTASGIKLPQMNELKQRVSILQVFVAAYQEFDSIMPSDTADERKRKGEEVINQCSGLIKRSRRNHADSSLIHASLQIGDVFSLLLRLYFEKLNEPRNALKVLESMPKHGVDPRLFVERDLLERVCMASGKQVSDVLSPLSTGKHNSTDNGAHVNTTFDAVADNLA